MRRGFYLLMTAAAALPMLSSCGLRPLYSGGTSGIVASELGNVEVAPIPGKSGWLLRNALNDHFSSFSSGASKYRLVVAVDDNIQGFGERADDSVTGERRSLRTRFQLVRLDDDVTVVDATAGSDAGIDVVSSEYATIAAEETALENLSKRVAEQIISRLALYARSTAKQP